MRWNHIVINRPRISLNMKKKGLLILCLATLCLATSCNQARLHGIDKEINALEQEDAKILKELSAAIDELEKTLLAKIQESNDKLNGDIDAAVLDMMAYLKSKMEDNQAYLETELARRKEQCDEVVSVLRARAQDVTGELDKALDNTRARIQQAIADNDKDMERKLRLLQESIGEAYDCVDDAEAGLKKWEDTIRKFEATGMYDAMDNMQALMKKILDYDVQSSIDQVEAYAKNFARVNLDKLSKDELESMRELVSNMDAWMDDAQGYVSDSETLRNEMADLLDDWQERADNLYGSVESIRDEVMTGYEEIVAVYEDVADDILFEADNVLGKLEHMEAQKGRMENCASSVDGCIGILEDDYAQMEDKTMEIESLSDNVVDLAVGVINACERTQEWLDDHPWVYDQ